MQPDAWIRLEMRSLSPLATLLGQIQYQVLVQASHCAWAQYRQPIVRHQAWHVPGFFGVRQKIETEADFIAYAGLIPVHLLNQYEDWEIAEEYGYPLAYVKERCRLWRIYHH